jgi:hypothetical protein
MDSHYLNFFICPNYLVKLNSIKFVSADAEAGHSGYPFSRHRILTRPVGHTSPLIFQFQHGYTCSGNMKCYNICAYKKTHIWFS